ncbi:MAG: calcium/sodium antiporter [Candidatus Latescibacterota bacterium]|nr:calcium/sodium antiporter [Candidatus Latescibacterota bacterium]
MWLNLLLIIIGGIALWLGANGLVEGATRLARRFGLSDLVIGLTVVAIGTSAPEFAVTLTAAIDGKAAVSLGNIVGSNIFNIGIILGGVVLFGSVQTARQLVFRDTPMLLLASLALIGFTYDNLISQWEGAFFFVTLSLYVFQTLRNARQSGKSEKTLSGQWKITDMVRLVGGLISVIIGAQLLVDNAVAIAQNFGLSEWMIGVTIVAIGTSLPELATSAAAAVRGNIGLSAGNLVGSDLFNVLGVLGVTALINPLETSIESRSDLVLMSIHIAIVLLFLRTGWKLKSSEGVILIVLGLARWGLNFV